MIILYDSKTTDFNNNGIVVLGDAISCPVVEELNGSYECTLEYPLDTRGKWRYLLEDNIIKVDGQLFRIYYKFKSLTIIKVNARHIFYDNLDNFLEDVTATNTTGYAALDSILSNTQYEHPFISMGDVSGINTKSFVRKNVVEAIMGQDGIINTWGGELVRDNFTIKLMQSRGLDRGVLVSYGKNIQGIEETLDMDGLCTRLMPVGKDGLLLSEKYIDSPYVNNFAHPKIKVVEFSDLEDETTLRAASQQYMLDSKCDIPQFNYKIDFIELSKTEEYKNYAVLERVYLGDTVTIKHSKLNIKLKAKVIKITKNVLTNRIEKIELGSFKPNLATSINNSIQEVKKDIVQVTSAYQKAIDNATALITGSKGGNVVIRQGEDGKPYEILIMDTVDVMTAVNVWRWNLGGFGHSITGINGPYETAITQDGHIVASFITALEINGEQITAGIIESKTGKWQINLDGETFTLGDKLIFDGTNLTFGDGVTLSWADITDQPTIPTQYTDTMALDKIKATYIDANGVLTPSVYAQNINTSGAKIKTAQIESLEVGTNVTMGENATMAWDKVTSQPSIPSIDGLAKTTDVNSAISNSASSTLSTANSNASAYANNALATANSNASSYATNAISVANANIASAQTATLASAAQATTTKLTQDYIVTGRIACDMLGAPSGHWPIIRLLTSTASIDATASGETGYGSEIRLKWNASSYLSVNPSRVAVYMNGAECAEIRADGFYTVSGGVATKVGSGTGGTLVFG